MNPYEILGVSENASEGEIKKAYKALARKWHPDFHKGDKQAEEKFKEINGAYETLKNNNWQLPQEQGFNISDIFSQAFNMGFNPFSSDPFQTRKIRRRKAQLEITFEEAFNGCEKDIKIQNVSSCNKCNGSGLKLKDEMCPKCQGSGNIVHQQGFITMSRTCSACRGIGRKHDGVCENCHGKGKIINIQEMKVQIPPHTLYGNIIRPEDDLDITIVYKKHPIFSLLNDGTDIGSSLNIDIFDAILGNSIDVQTLSGSKRLKINPGTQPGTILKVGEGGFRKPNGQRGDHLIEINVNIPKELNEEQKDILASLKNSFEGESHGKEE